MLTKHIFAKCCRTSLSAGSHQKLTLLLLLFFSGLQLQAQHYRPFADTTICLELCGKILNAMDGPERQCRVELWNHTGVVDTVVLRSGEKNFKILLRRDQYYGIRMVKKGYVDKLISVNTKLAAEEMGVWKFSFKTHMTSLKEARNMNPEIIDFPVAIIMFDDFFGDFGYSYEYTSYIQRELYAVADKPLRK